MRQPKTYGQMMNEALAINNQDEADKWFAEEVKAMQEANPEWDSEKCVSVVRSNLGYMAGYYNDNVAQHVHKFFNANHPIFGGSDYHKTMSPTKAFNKGKEINNETP